MPWGMSVIGIAPSSSPDDLLAPPFAGEADGEVTRFAQGPGQQWAGVVRDRQELGAAPHIAHEVDRPPGHEDLDAVEDAAVGEGSVDPRFAPHMAVVARTAGVVAVADGVELDHFARESRQCRSHACSARCGGRSR